MHKTGDKVTLGDLIPGTSFTIPGGETEYMVLARIPEVITMMDDEVCVPFVRCDYVFSLLVAPPEWDVVVVDVNKFHKMRLTKSA